MDIDSLERARKTIVEMLEDRGFVVPASQQQISKANFTAMYDNNTINIFVSRTGGDENINASAMDAAAAGDDLDDDDDAAGPAGQGVSVAAGETDDEETHDDDGGEQEDDGDEDDDEDDDDDDDDEEDVLEDVVENVVEQQEGGGGGADDADEDAAAVRDESEVTIMASGHISQILPYDQRGGAHSGQVYVYFHISNSKFDKKRLVAQVEKIKETYGNDDINIIFVIQEATAPVLKEAEKEAYRNVEIFDFKSLRVNFSRNRIVPHHQLLTPEEVAEVAVKYGMTEEDVFRDFPRIYTTDPMARYYGLREGDICRIVNRNTGEVEYAAIYKGLRGE